MHARVEGLCLLFYTCIIQKYTCVCTFACIRMCMSEFMFVFMHECMCDTGDYRDPNTSCNLESSNI